MEEIYKTYYLYDLEGHLRLVSPKIESVKECVEGIIGKPASVSELVSDKGKVVTVGNFMISDKIVK